MKKTLATITLAATILTTGCASTSPWDGIPYQERQAWSGIGVAAFDAKQLRHNGFTPNDISQWIQYGIRSPQVIVKWHRAGFTPRQTAKWLKKGISLREAIDLTS